MHAALVTTTIRVPRCLGPILEDCASHPGRMTRLTVVVIGDRKSDPATGSYLSGLARSHPFDVQWWDIERQRGWLARVPDLDRAIPENSIQRRNVGYLLAALAGAATIISIDDDNFLGGDPFLPDHLTVGQEVAASEVSTSSGWFDPCLLMHSERGRRVYHRGYPASLRGRDGAESYARATRRVAVNVGLWTGTPDANAWSHIEDPATFSGFRPDARVPLLLGRDTLAPFNSQNTAWDAKLVPCSYLLVMGDEIDGQRVGRYDDIWQAYFAEMVIRATGGAVLFGRPLLEQRRNPHDFLDDLAQEVPAARMTETLLPFFRTELGASTPRDAYGELTDRLEAFVASAPFRRAERTFWEKAIARMRAWTAAVATLGLA
ncbi:MAG: hypothetical protein U0166_14180 [Acidobacteriota bacterium]